MSIADLPLFSALKSKMHWHQTRQKVLAENVANADTPGFRPSDVREMRAPGEARLSPVVMRTSPLHIAGAGDSSKYDSRDAKRFETTPSGNAVVLEDEMMKVAQNQADYQMATMLYTKSLQLMKTALGRRG